MRLTTNAAVDSSPDWSPDGTKIAFASKRTGNGDIYVINGSAQTRLTTNPAVDGEPSFSPHARTAGKIDFVSNRDGNSDIYAMNASGAQWRLTTNTAARQLSGRSLVTRIRSGIPNARRNAHGHR